MRQFVAILICGIPLILWGCGEMSSGRGPCGGGIEAEGSCVRVEKMEPAFILGVLGEEEPKVLLTSAVDIFLNPDCDGDPATVDPEPFADHSAKVTFSNTLLPDIDQKHQRDVTLTGYTVAYSLAHCPEGLQCPLLTPNQIGATLFLPAGGTEEFSLVLVTLGTKNEYLQKGGGVNAFPTYTATYTFSGEDEFGSPISLTAATGFTVGDYDFCPKN